jgi:hypothetical protein
MIGSIAELGVYLGLGSIFEDDLESQLTLHLNIANAMAEVVIGYPLNGAETIYLDGDGTNHIWLPYFPINEITAAAYQDNTIYPIIWTSYDLTGIICDKATGEIYFDSLLASSSYIGLPIFPRGFQNIRFTFSFGYPNSLTDTDPKYMRFVSLKFAVYEIAGLIFKNPGELSFQTFNDGVTRTRYDFASNFVQMLSPESLSILHSFAKRSAAR